MDGHFSPHCCHNAKDLLGLEGLYVEGARQVANPQTRDDLVHRDGVVVVWAAEWSQSVREALWSSSR